jgi:hypothetical protein
MGVSNTYSKYEPLQLSLCPMCGRQRIDKGMHVGDPPEGGFCGGHRVEDVLAWAGVKDPVQKALAGTGKDERKGSRPKSSRQRKQSRQGTR